MSEITKENWIEGGGDWVTQKLVLQQSKKRHSKVYGNPIAPSFYSILLGLKYIIFALKVTNSDINISIIFSVIISIFIFDLSAYLLVTIWPDFYLKFFWNSTEENRKICNIFYLVNSYFFLLKSVAITVSLKGEQLLRKIQDYLWIQINTAISLPLNHKHIHDV